MTDIDGTGERDLYGVLQVDPDADLHRIQAAYRALARRYHPDLTADPATAAVMAELNAAYEVLGDLGRRAQYDQARREAAEARAKTSATPGGNGEAGQRSEPRWTGAAGRPPGHPSGSVLPFGRYKGWSLGEIARMEPYYLVWLEDKREGRPYLGEIDIWLKRLGYRRETSEESSRRRFGGRTR